MLRPVGRDALRIGPEQPSRNLAEGFARLERYQRIIAEASDLTFRRTPQGYRIGVTVHGEIGRAHV